METITVHTQTAIKYEVEVTETGHVEIEVPFPPGSRVTIFVVEETVDNFSDLLAASQSSLDFWDHSYDDEDWSMMLTTYKELACTA